LKVEQINVELFITSMFFYL